METRKKRAPELIINKTPMSNEDLIQYYLKHHDSVGFHGKKKDLDRVLDQIPFFFTLKMDNGITPQSVIGSQQYYDHKPFSEMVPPAWYTSFCKYCEENKDQNCALMIYGITECEPSKQVYLNSLLLNHSLRLDLWPLPSNSAVFVMLEDENDAEHRHFNLTGQVFDRLCHVFLKEEEWKDNMETDPSTEDK